MGDPRNVAHAKKVIQEKHHKGDHMAKRAVHAPQPGKKTQLAKKQQAVAGEGPATKAGEVARPDQKQDRTRRRKRLASLPKPEGLRFTRGAITEKSVK